MIPFLQEYGLIILFYSTIVLLVYINRKKFDREGKFMYLLRTKYGLKFIDSVAKYKKTVKSIAYVGKYVGFGGIFFIVYLVGKMFIDLFVAPMPATMGLLIPGFTVGAFKIPLIAGWVALFIIIVIHEFSHGIVARVNNLKIKASGIAFFGPLMGAFVEPDEKQLVKENTHVQNTIFAAGPFANIVTSFVFLALLIFIFVPLASSLAQVSGIEVSPINNTPAFVAGITEGTIITSLNNISIIDIEEFNEGLSSLKPNQTVELLTKEGQLFTLTTIAHPDNESIGYMGVNINAIQEQRYPGLLGLIGYHSALWLVSLFHLLWFISVNLGLVNLFPIFITDGARMLQVTMNRYCNNKKRAMKIWVIINKLGILMLLMLLFFPFVRDTVFPFILAIPTYILSLL